MTVQSSKSETLKIDQLCKTTVIEKASRLDGLIVVQGLTGKVLRSGQRRLPSPAAAMEISEDRLCLSSLQSAASTKSSQSSVSNTAPIPLPCPRENNVKATKQYPKYVSIYQKCLTNVVEKHLNTRIIHGLIFSPEILLQKI